MPPVSPAPPIRFGRFELQPAARRLLADGLPVALGGRALDVLLALVEQPDRAVSKSQLLDSVWPRSVVGDNTLQVHVSALRKLLGAHCISTVPGHGYRFTAPLLTGPAPDADTAAAPRAVTHKLPQPHTRFIGRQAALARAARLLLTAHLLTLTGMGGCGKTRLALALAEREGAGFADGVWFVDLAPLQAPDQLAPAVAAVVGLCEEPGATLLERLATFLAGRCCLIVLDNCEHLIDATAVLVDALLTGCGHVKILATSRQALGVAGEQLFPVQALSLPSASNSAAAQDCEAVRLFIDRAGLAAPDFDCSPEQALTIGHICRRLDGIALAIELAAARIGMLSVEQINEHLADRFKFLVGASHAQARHQTLQTTLHWSHDSLNAAEQKLFCQLAVFAGGCTLAAVTEVAGLADGYSALALLTRLHDKSLLVIDQVCATPPRFGMLETVRQYALEKLVASGQEQATRQRHLSWLLALTEEASEQLQGPQQGVWMVRLAAEQDNLLVAHGWCAAGGPLGAQAACQLVASLWRYWVASAQLERGHGLCLAALALAEQHAGVDARCWCRAWWACGQMAFRMGHHAESMRCADQCLRAAVANGDAEQIAAGLGLHAKGLHACGQLDDALLQYEQACTVARTLDNTGWLGTALNNLAELHRSRSQHAAARACYEEAISIARARGSPEGTFVPLCNLARLSVAGGQLEEARGLLLESWHLATGADLKGMDEDVLEVAAGLAAAEQAFALAARFSGAALARLQQGGSQREAVDEAFVAPLMFSACTALGAATFATAQAAGWALGHAAAMAEVRRWLQSGGQA